MYVCVFCSGAPLTVQNLKLQLNGGRRKGEGIVEVGIGNTWGAVCIDHWEMHTARLICKRLGYQTALASVKNIPLRTKFATRDLIHFVNRFHCSGEETSINECELVWETGQCQGGKDAYAGVVCSGEHNQPQSTWSQICSTYMLTTVLTVSMYFTYCAMEPVQDGHCVRQPVLALKQLARPLQMCTCGHVHSYTHDVSNVVIHVV